VRRGPAAGSWVYTEVTVIISRSGVKRAICVSLAGAMVLGAVGCAGLSDMAADSTQSREAGNQYYNSARYADAVGAYSNATRKDPRDYKAQYGLACAYDQLHHYQQALQQYETTLDVMTRTLAGREDPDFRAHVIDSLASCIARSDVNSEITALRQKAPSDRTGEAYYILAKTYAYKGDADSSLDAYNKASLTAPKNFYIARDYGLYLEKLGQNQKAATELTRAYRLNQQDAQVNAGLRKVGITPGPQLLDDTGFKVPLLSNVVLPGQRGEEKTPVPPPPPSLGGTSGAMAPRD
jgi:Flp pilus assembly protein TadD